jgi:pilus assembly protein Flp/PilA
VLEKGGLMIRLLVKLLADDRGVTAVEYGLIAKLISVAIVSVLTTVGQHLSTTFNTVATRL